MDAGQADQPVIPVASWKLFNAGLIEPCKEAMVSRSNSLFPDSQPPIIVPWR
jgi:hypothetical protein